MIGFAWDEGKSERCLRERGFSFDFVVPAFADPDRQGEIDDRWHHGEKRYRLYGRIEGRLFVKILRDGSERPLVPQVDWARIDATTEAEIAAQIADDDAEAKRDAAAYARRVRRKVGLSQVAFARRIGVSVDTVRNWEQGKRAPQGPARALLRVIDRAPEAALQALDRN